MYKKNCPFRTLTLRRLDIMSEKSVPDSVVFLESYRKRRYPRSAKERKEGKLEELLDFLEKEVEERIPIFSDTRECAEKLLEDVKKAKKNLESQD